MSTIPQSRHRRWLIVALSVGAGLWLLALAFGIYVTVSPGWGDEPPGYDAAEEKRAEIRAKLAERAALQALERRATDGDLDAMLELAGDYSEGTDGAPHDATNAFKWSLAAAKANSADAMRTVANCYEHGNGTTADRRQALDWYSRAAEHGNADAARRLGDWFYDGEDAPTDYATAFKWYRIAADDGDADGRRHIAYMLELGLGVERDLPSAYYRYAQLAESGDAWSQYKAGSMLWTGTGVASDPRAAVKWFSAASEGGNVAATTNLAIAYLTGQGAEHNEAEGRRLLQRAVEAKSTTAMVKMARAHLAGEWGYAKDNARAIELLRRAGALGDDDAKFALAQLKLTGRGMPKDVEEARLELEVLALRRHAESEAAVAEFYLAGSAGVAVDVEKARRLLRDAADGGVGSAQARLDAIPPAVQPTGSVPVESSQSPELAVDPQLMGSSRGQVDSAYSTTQVFEMPSAAKTLDDLQAEMSASIADMKYDTDRGPGIRADTPPAVVVQHPPIYPFELRARNVTGWVLVDFVVNSEGKVFNAFAIKSSLAAFEKPAVEAVSQWRFKPGLKAGQPVPVHMQVPIVFNLQDDHAGTQH